MADFTGAPEDPLAVPYDYGASVEPWPPPHWIGGAPQVEETAAPVPAAQPQAGYIDPLVEMPGDVAEVQLSQPKPASWVEAVQKIPNLQPGLGIPTSTLDSLPPPPEPDAVSGAGQVVPLDVETLTGPITYDKQPALPPTQSEWNAAETARRAQLTPEQRLAEDADRQLREENFLRDAEDRAAADALFRKEAIDKNLRFARDQAREKTAALQEEALKLAEDRVDSNRWMRDGGPGRVVSSFVAAIAGGLMAGKTGGPNMGLQFIENAIERDIAAQKANLQLRRDNIAMKRGFVADNLQAAVEEANWEDQQRIAQYQRAIAVAQKDLEGLDPQGTQYRRRQQIVAGIVQNQQATLDRLEKRNLEFGMARAKLQNELADAALKHAKLRGAVGGSGGGAGGAKAEKQVYTADTLKAVLPPGAWVPPKGWTGTLAEYSKLADASNKGLEVGSKTEANQSQAIGGVVGEDGQWETLKQSDGTAWHPPKESRQKIADRRTAAARVAESLNMLMALREEAGGANKLTSPGDQAEYTRLTKSIVFDTGKLLDASVADEQSQNALRDMQLGMDPSNYNIGDAISRMERSLDRLTRNYLDEIRVNGYTGPDSKAVQWGVNVRRLAPATTSAAQQRTKRVLAAPAMGPRVDAPNEELEGDSIYEIATNAAVQGDTSYDETMQRLHDGMLSKDQKTREAAGAELLHIATKANSAGVRDRAAYWLNKAQQAWFSGDVFKPKQAEKK